MGLFGPSWSWEEIQKKDALMGELKKENDRVLDKQRKENNRVIKELNKNNSSNQSNQNVSNNYSLSPDDYKFLYDTRTLESNVRSSFEDCILASRNTIKILKIIIKDLLINVFCCLFFLFLLFLSRHITWLFIILLILNFFALRDMYDFFKYSIFNPLHHSKIIRKTRCYQGILSELEKLKLDEIKYISVNRIGVKVIDKSDISKEICYQQYDFPNLAFEKQGILLGSLLCDLQLNRKMTLSAPNGYYLENTNLCVRGIVTNPESFKVNRDYQAFFLAENKKLLLKLEKERAKVQKENRKILEKNIRDGNTW